MKRSFDILASFLGLLILSPLLILLIVLIPLDGKGSPFYRQIRIGKDGEPFGLLKFRTMIPKAEEGGSLTVGNDPRVTRVGAFLRRSKLDELPQLINVLKGDMSFVGPRPEVPEYVAHYDEEQRKVLKVRPGLTDEASLAYIREAELLENADDPDRVYRERILPEKLRLNLRYMEERSMKKDLSLILRTILKIIRG